MSTDTSYVKCLKQIIRLLNQSVNLLLITQTTDQESIQTYGLGGYCGGSQWWCCVLFECVVAVWRKR